MNIIVATPDLETATSISEIIVDNFNNDPMYSRYTDDVLSSYVDTNAPYRVSQAIRNPLSQCFVGKVDEKISGLVLLGFYPSGYPEEESQGAWRIRRLHVDKSFRHMGYATDLLLTAETFVSNQAYRDIYAEPTPEASPLLLSHGWIGKLTTKAVTYRDKQGNRKTTIVPRVLAHKTLIPSVGKSTVEKI